MSARERIIRIAIGLCIVGLLVVGGFALVMQFIPTWGASPAEVAQVLPGDELLANPGVNWTHGITIDAPAEQVWGWIAQIGERRGAFYSYTFIENQVGNGDVYHNAARIVPEWQNPKPGDVLIGGTAPMRVYQVEPYKRLTGYMTGPFDWAWSWHLQALDAQHTRLIVRMQIQFPPGASNPLMDNGLALGGFVMEQAMLQGIRARAEGNVPPANSETLELVIWLSTLAAGVVAGVYFVVFKEWIVPFVVGILAIVALFHFTFVQPPLWTRIATDLVLWGGLVWFTITEYRARSTRPAPRGHSGQLTLKPSA